MAILVAPSILSADFGRINAEIKGIEGASDLIHVDVMDGHFVPNITFGPGQIAHMRSKKPFDVHLMIEHPERYVERFAEAVKRAVGARNYAKSFLVVHEEVLDKPAGVLAMIKKMGMRAGIAINPATPWEVVIPVLPLVDMVLCMTVQPGFGGQKFISSVLQKVRKLRAMKPKLLIEVDGGINDKTAKLCIKAGANVLVAGNYVFASRNRVRALKLLKG